MQLTLRQKAFFDKLVDLYREAQRPVHYSVLARGLGVSRFSAYDMLKLLEAKGLVRSEYVLDEREGGPGRSSVVFAPLLRAQELLSRLVTNPVEQSEWAQTVAHILGHLRQEQTPAGPRDSGLLEELMAAIPKAMSPLAYSAQTLTALLLPVRNRLASLDRDLTTILNLDDDAPSPAVGWSCWQASRLALRSPIPPAGWDATFRRGWPSTPGSARATLPAWTSNAARCWASSCAKCWPIWNRSRRWRAARSGRAPAPRRPDARPLFVGFFGFFAPPITEEEESCPGSP